MLDISVAYNKYKFLGYEFLTWLWFAIDNHPEDLLYSGESSVRLSVGNKIILENHMDNRSEILSIKGDHASFNEGLLALKKGAMVTELQLVMEEDQNKWQFTVKGENINFLNLKHPDTGPMETAEDMEGFVLEKIYHYNKAVYYIEAVYKKFIHLRLSGQWLGTVVPQIKNWIASSL